MTCWTKRGDGLCPCGRVGTGAATREATIQFLRASGWHHSAGTTIGGEQYEALLCPQCARDERKRTITKTAIEQEGLPFDWDSLRIEATGNGVASR